MLMMQFTDSLIVHSFSFSCFRIYLLHWLWNPPNKCAKMSRQINAPKWPAKMSCHENLPDSPARMIRRIYSPEKSAISTRGLLARDPPSLLKIPRLDPARQPSPPHSSANGAGGRGQGGNPAHPRILNSTFTFFPLSWMATYPCITRHIHILHRAD